MTTVPTVVSFMLFLSSSLSGSEYTTLTVATYNLWNVMFQWEVRKHHIADMIKQSSTDIIALQEVRSDGSGKRNQILELQQLVPEYKHSIFHSVSTVQPPLGLRQLPGWEKEGIGILSKHPPMLSHVVNLSSGRTSPDTNNRVLLHAQFNVRGQAIDVTVVHFSYDKAQQCENAMDVIDYIATIGSGRSVVLGDFNAYNDFPWPIHAVMRGYFHEDSTCTPRRRFQTHNSRPGYGFIDAWTKVHPQEEGFTFSNMPDPGLVSRPDRILVANVGLEIISAELLGDGKAYKERYSFWNKWQRLKTVIHMARETANRPNFSYSCYHDCGPHGSCRCGVCVKGGDKNNCDLPFCYECDAAHHQSFIMLMILYSSVFLFLLYIFGKFLLRRCSLIHRGRKSPRIIFLCSNKTAFPFVILLLFSMYVITMSSFSDSLKTAEDRIPEEMFPSDHLMLAAKLKFTYR